ncbi:MAG: Ig-like domain-containing protein [Synergistaceae bacterium]|nr:Ig-like domain-containing protein [Synergistaceae bacterium]
MRKTILAVMIIMSLFITSGALAAPEGSAENPKLISTAEELDNVRINLNMYYKLSNDIDLTPYLEIGGAGYAKWGKEGWLPVGSEDLSFIGGFNGDRHKVKGLWLDRRKHCLGLFGHVTNATIENLGVVLYDTGIKGDGNNVGGLVGFQSGGDIVNCYAIGDVYGNIDTGGLVGYMEDGVIKNCYATVNVSSSESDAGGLVGFLADGYISNCYATGNVSSISYVGGLVGYNTGGNVSNCYATGNISGNFSGGLAGFLVSDEGITNSYRYKNLKMNGSIIPENDTFSSPDRKHGGIVTGAELLTKETYTGNSWLFNNPLPLGPWIWDNKGFPKLNTAEDNFPFINIGPVIIISVNPVDKEVTEGSINNITDRLSVFADVTNGTALSYQWYSNTAASNTSGDLLPNETNTIFAIPTDLVVGTHYYYCIVSSPGAESVNSSVATVTVKAKGDTTVVTVSGVTINQSSITMRIGEFQTLTASVIPQNATNKNVDWGTGNSRVATVSDTGRVTAINTGTTVITATTRDGGFKASCDVTVADYGHGFFLLTPEYPSDKAETSETTGIPESSIDASGKRLFLSMALANKIAMELLRADAVNTNILPIFSGKTAYNGETVAVMFSVRGSELLVRYPFEVKLIGMTSKNTGKLFAYASKSTDYSVGKFTVLYNGSIFLGEINPNNDYELLFFIKDGGEFDLDGQVNGEVISSIFLAYERIVKDSGGCNAGFGYIVLALLGISTVYKKQ